MARGNLVSDDFVRRASNAIRKSERDPAVGRRTRRVTWPTSGGAQIIRFTVATIDCDTGDITGTVANIMCSASDTAIGDTITLVDSLGFLTGNPELMIGHSGMGVKMLDARAYGDSCAYEIMAMDDLGTNCA